MIGKIATGENEEEREGIANAAAQMGKLGGKARAAAMTPERRSQIARNAAKCRWEDPAALVPKAASEKLDQ